MDSTEVENAVREIIEKHLDTSAASLKYKADVAKATSVMATQIVNLLQGTAGEEYDGYDWFSLTQLEFVSKRKNEYLPPELIISYYEDSLIARNLLEYVETVHPEIIENIGKGNENCIESYRNGYYPSSCLRQLFRGPEGKLSEEEARERLNVLENELGCFWNYEKAEYLYNTIYQLTTECLENEYEARKEAEELYEEYCQETNRPLIILPDFFYDLREYSLKHIMRYRCMTIIEKCFYYTDRYRLPVNAWFWQSIEKAVELQQRYHEERVGITEFGGFGTMALSYYLFNPHLALIKFRCNRIADESVKHREVLDFLNFQYRGYPDETYLGFPTMYKDICAYIGVKPVNLAQYEEEEKELVKIHDAEKIRVLRHLV